MESVVAKVGVGMAVEAVVGIAVVQSMVAVVAVVGVPVVVVGISIGLRGSLSHGGGLGVSGPLAIVVHQPVAVCVWVGVVSSVEGAHNGVVPVAVAVSKTMVEAVVGIGISLGLGIGGPLAVEVSEVVAVVAMSVAVAVVEPMPVGVSQVVAVAVVGVVSVGIGRSLSLGRNSGKETDSSDSLQGMTFRKSLENNDEKSSNLNVGRLTTDFIMLIVCKLED
jgi:hypothetical protein